MPTLCINTITVGQDDMLSTGHTVGVV